MKDNKSASLFPKEQVIESLKQSFVKLNPRMMLKNPIMFTVEVATVVMLLVTLYSIVNSSQGSFAYNIAVFIILFATLLFANFAEAIAEARVKHRPIACVRLVKRHRLRKWKAIKSLLSVLHS